MKISYGFVETKGYVAAIEAADAMVKAAKVEVVGWRKAGGALVMVIVKGQLDACSAAVDAGGAAADRVGQLVSAHVIPNPYEDTELLVSKYLQQRKRKQAPKAKEEIPLILPPKKVTKKPAKPKKVKPAPVKPTPKPEPKVTKKKKTPPSSPQERLLDLIASVPSGITIKQLSADLKKPVADVRKGLKKLMDKNAVEKVQQRYFVVHPGSKK